MEYAITGRIRRRARGVYLADLIWDETSDEAYEAFPTLKAAKAWCQEQAGAEGGRWERVRPDYWRIRWTYTD